MSDVCIKSGSYCPVCRGLILRDCRHSAREFHSGSQYLDELLAAKERIRALEAAQPAPGAWQPIETAPHQKNVLIAYTNELSKSRVVKAKFVPRYTEEAPCEGFCDSGCDEYDEENDRYTVIEGWYEQIDNWDAYSEIFIHYKPTHWQPLPAPPAAHSGEGESK